MQEAAENDKTHLSIPWLRELKLPTVHARCHGRPARAALAPPTSSPLCCLNLQKQQQQQQQQRECSFPPKPMQQHILFLSPILLLQPWTDTHTHTPAHNVWRYPDIRLARIGREQEICPPGVIVIHHLSIIIIISGSNRGRRFPLESTAAVVVVVASTETYCCCVTTTIA